MCVIVHQPKGSHLDKKRAQRLWTLNSDGGGFAYISDEGEIVVEKSMEFESFWSKFERARSDNPRRDFLIHMRIATHGTISIHNVHPFQVNETTVMAHNGIIHGVPTVEDGRSDTRVFIDEVLPRLPELWLDDPYLRSMVEEWIGWSKLMFLTTDERLSQRVYILNYKAGAEVDGMWFSNESGVHVVKKSQFGPSRAAHANAEWWERHTLIATKTPHLDEHRRKTNLVARRKTAGLTQPITLDQETQRYYCWGCDGFVSDDVNGECDCYYQVCMDCEQFAAFCVCPGYSTNLMWYDNIDEETQVRLHVNTVPETTERSPIDTTSQTLARRLP